MLLLIVLEGFVDLGEFTVLSYFLPGLLNRMIVVLGKAFNRYDFFSLRACNFSHA